MVQELENFLEYISHKKLSESTAHEVIVFSIYLYHLSQTSMMNSGEKADRRLLFSVKTGRLIKVEKQNDCWVCEQHNNY